MIAGATTGLLLTRHSTPAMRPVAVGVGAVPAPTGPIVAAFPSPTGPIVAVSQSAAPKPVAAPVSLTIPLIGVQTNLMTLGLASDGTLQVPPRTWSRLRAGTRAAPGREPSARPSSWATSTAAGDVKGVFFRLRQLSAGDKIYVKRSDGTLVEFRVTSVQQYLKDHFPTQAVYGAVPDPELRLITCDGTFDLATGHYLSNIVVYATEVS